MSVLGNAKSNRHRKTHQVKPDGAGREFTHLTRGGLPCESKAGVSRGRSSEEARRKAGGAKGRRTTKVRSADRLGSMARRDVKQRGATTTVATSAARRVGAGGFRFCPVARGLSQAFSGMEVMDDAQ